MDTQLRELDRDEATLEAVHRVCESCFPGITLATLRSNWFDSSPLSTFFGAYVDGELVAVNGFLAHRILLDGVRGEAYQSCWSATLPNQRGKGLFTLIIEGAKLALRGRAAFMFGFPNAKSGPIFTGKLGFRQVPMVRLVYCARGPASLLQRQFQSDRYFADVGTPGVVRFDQFDCAAWKKTEHADLVEVDFNTNYLWGRMSKRTVAGIQVKTLLVGGCELSKPQQFGRLLKGAAQVAGATAVRFVCTQGGLIPASSRLVLSGDRTEPFIAFGLDVPVDHLRFDAHTGLKDAY